MGVREGCGEDWGRRAPPLTPTPPTHPQTSVLLDPYARAIVGRRAWGELGPEDATYGAPDGRLGAARTWPQAAAALPPRVDAFDWRGDRPLATPMQDLVIYEMHVRGFTVDPSSGVAAPGKWR